MEQRRVLVVASGKPQREQVARWLDEAYEVMTCPGPQGPEACLGVRGPRCPLAGGADVVVLDMGAEGDPLGGSVAGWELLNAYLDLGLPVVALTEPGDAMLREGRNRVISLPRRTHRRKLRDAVAQGLAAAV
jgi:hypothetical protein